MKSSPKTKASFVIMGLGQILYHQYVKGILYLASFCGIAYYMICFGFRDIRGFFTLGETEGDAWLGIVGDDSILMLLRGIFAFFVLILFVVLYRSNVHDILKIQKTIDLGGTCPKFTQAVANYLDKSFYKAALVLPIAGVLLFNVLPIIFMILIAFTNYGGKIIPPKLVDWIGFANFKKILVLSELKDTFFKILGWNITWAIFATALNYFGGLFLALLLNKKCVRKKAFWRAFPLLAYALPGFITLLAFKFMFSYGGPVNYYITLFGHKAVGFLDIDAGIKAKLIGLIVNAWISIPSMMLLTTGILSNRSNELLEAAAIDGASKWKQFVKITLPFVVFSTTPVLITSFIGNFNNFGIFYFLRGGLYCDGYFLASDTDLLINWLYNLSIANNYYGIGAAISLLIFLITSMISLAVYVRSQAFRKEDTFR